ncbi:Thymidylate kinase [Rickettsiales bacterium Ac37b]|nr:Thymidylate kinase [Rickettsiales bacterium Ac37b]
MMHSFNNIPLFITFEGGEGAGKSTQSNLLYKALEKNNSEVLHTREPGGTKSAEVIRELLTVGPTDKWQPNTELLLHMAARVEHVELVIKPSLKQRKTVICDRFLDSTIAYQGYGHQLGQDIIIKMHELVLGNFYPDITIMINVSPHDAMKRIAGSIKRKTRPARYENMGEAFHKRVLDGFSKIVEMNPDRYIVINGNQTIERVHKEIILSLNSKFNLSLLSVL